MLLVYSDGFRTVTVGWAVGALPADAPDGAQRSSGQPSVVARQVGEQVILIATDGSAALLAQAAEELPDEQPYPDSLRHRLGRGLERLLGNG